MVAGRVGWVEGPKSIRGAAKGRYGVIAMNWASVSITIEVIRNTGMDGTEWVRGEEWVLVKRDS